MYIMENLSLKIVNAIVFLGTIAANFFVINGIGSLKPIGNISDEYNTLITPPDWAFSIWGLIYSGLLLFSICQFIPQLKLNQQVKDIGWLFIFSCIFNVGWLFTFSIGTKYSILGSVFIILGLLITLFLIQERVGFFSKNSSLYKILFVDTPFSLYFGWIITASIVNIATSIRAFYVNANYNYTFYIVMLIVALIIYLLFLMKRNNYGSYLVFIYVLVSLIIKYKDNFTLAPYTNMSLVTYTSVILAFALICLFIKICSIKN